MKLFNVIGISCLLAVSAFTHAAPTYIQPKPLAQVVKTSVGKVRGSEINLPIITWGGDIATIYANGSDKKTQKNSLFRAQGLNFKLSRNDDFSKQVENYIKGNTPYLRGTLGMINAASDVLANNQIGRAHV